MLILGSMKYFNSKVQIFRFLALSEIIDSEQLDDGNEVFDVAEKVKDKRLLRMPGIGHA